MNLLIFLSDRCTMECDYCWLDLNHGAASVLKEADAKQAVLDHCKKFGRDARFTILGGEPLIHFPLLVEIVRAIRAKSPQAPVSVVTNGTLACPKMLDELAELRAGLVVSLDGRAAENDGHRKLVGSKESALETVLRNLESCDKKSLRANMFVSPDTAASLLRSVEFLREAGFSELSFHLDVMREWSAEELAVIEKALAGVSRYAKALPPGALRLSHLDSFPETPLDHEYDDLVLGADGKYYPCDGLFAKPYKDLERWACGDAATGPNWKARAAWHRNAREFIHARLGRPGHFSCAREAYFRAQVLGLDPDPAVRSFHEADELMGTALAGLKETHASR
jgi:MoaA/NifB/PqqE/SkfB family radical SAM enzyme